MRHLVLATALVALTPIAYAQTNAPGSVGTPGYSSTPGGAAGAATGGVTGGSAGQAPASAMSSGQAGGQTTGQLDPGNCGTPDEPKPCGPMPRHALKHMQAKHSNGAS